MDFIYSGSSKQTMEAAFASYGIFLKQKDCTESTYQVAFNEERGSKAPFGEDLILANRNLLEAGLLKEHFYSQSEQNKLKIAFRRAILVYMLRTSYFGFSDTLKIIFRLTGSQDTPDYGMFFTEPHMSTLPALSFNAKNKLAYGYSRLVKEHLSTQERQNIINEIKDTFDFIDISNTANEPIIDSFDRFSEDLMNMSNYFDIYEA